MVVPLRRWRSSSSSSFRYIRSLYPRSRRDLICPYRSVNWRQRPSTDNSFLSLLLHPSAGSSGPWIHRVHDPPFVSRFLRSGSPSCFHVTAAASILDPSIGRGLSSNIGRSHQAKYETHRLFRNPGDGGFLPVSPVARATALDPLFRSSDPIRCHISCRCAVHDGPI